MRIQIILLTILLHILMYVYSFAQEIPLVYDIENRGADCPAPPLPAFDDLPIIEPLPDPFESSDGSRRDTTFESWSCRRNEIKAEIEHYEIGPKPDRPDSIKASLNGDTLIIVNVTVNGNTLTLTSPIALPEGEGPFPAIIGMNNGAVTLPSDIFSSRNIATIGYIHDQVVTYSWTNTKTPSDPYYQLYPDLYYTGQYSSWIWGVSRLIDGLEMVSDSLPIDLKHLAVTGCSYAGKMALFAGAFDERIALTIAQESGGGGAAAWRVSETLGSVETLGATSHVWFMEDLFQFSEDVPKLPFDHHELMAMVAPRALFVIGNPDMVWLADESGYVSCRAAHKVWETFGVPERFGFSIVGHGDHCILPDIQQPEMEAFVDAFLLGDTLINTNITTNPYDYVNYTRWIEWWGTGNPEFPPVDTTGLQIVYYEPECATIGSNWNIVEDAGTSGGKYVTVRPDIESVSAAPMNSDDHIYITFSTEKDTTYYLFGRMNNPTPDDDSFWIKMDNGSFVMVNGLGTNGWQWERLTNYVLTAGEHNLTIAYRENGAKLDKICISNFVDPPEGMGGEAENYCATGIEKKETFDSYNLSQNYPNPFNPSTEISYKLPIQSFVTLKVYDVLGKEILTLINEKKPAGTYKINFDATGLVSGVYFYQLKAGNFIEKKKMVLIK